MTKRMVGPAAMTRCGAMTLGALLVLACGKGKEQPAAGESAGTAAPAGAPAAAPAAAPETPAAADTSKITTAMVAEGDSIFHGKAGGGLCFTCHGPDAKGTQLAPNLTDTQWISGDGSYGFIIDRVTKGMPTPTAPYTSPMLPMGGANLTASQIQAVAAYVFSLSHPGIGKKS